MSSIPFGILPSLAKCSSGAVSLVAPVSESACRRTTCRASSSSKWHRAHMKMTPFAGIGVFDVKKLRTVYAEIGVVDRTKCW